MTGAALPPDSPTMIARCGTHACLRLLPIDRGLALEWIGGRFVERLLIDCTGGARKESLVGALLEMLDGSARESFLARFELLGLDVDISEGTNQGEREHDKHERNDCGGRGDCGDRKHEHDGCEHDEHECEHDGHKREHEHEHHHHHEHDYPADEHRNQHYVDEHEHDERKYHHEHREYEHQRECEHHHEHEHHSVEEVLSAVASLGLSESVEASVRGVYGLLANAEAAAHGVLVDEVHFHEVGNKFAIAYIVAFCMLIDELAPARIVTTPITTGFGWVDCAHGRLAIPAPATANVLEGLPTRKGDIEGELTTPTGAALVRYFAESYEDARRRDESAQDRVRAGVHAHGA